MDLNPDGGKWRHLWRVSDVHGCRQWRVEERACRRFNSEADLLISTGDIIIRGQNSVKCQPLLQNKGFTPPAVITRKWR